MNDVMDMIATLAEHNALLDRMFNVKPEKQKL